MLVLTKTLPLLNSEDTNSSGNSVSNKTSSLVSSTPSITTLPLLSSSALILLPSLSFKPLTTLPISFLSFGPSIFRLGFAINDKFSNSLAQITSLVLD